MSPLPLTTETKLRFHELVQKLKDRGGRLTPQRLAVLRILSTSKEHPGVEEIFERVKVQFPSTSLATIYKTVNLLKDMGEIMELGWVGDRHRYDGARSDPHPHLVCIQCHKILDANLPGLKDLSTRLARQTGYRVIGHRLDFFGICPDCHVRKEGRARGRGKAREGLP